MPDYFASALSSPNWLMNTDYPLMVRRSFLVLAFMDILYLIFAIWQHAKVRGYPDPKWQKTKPRLALVLTHILFGSISIYLGSIFCLILEFKPSPLLFRQMTPVDIEGGHAVADPVIAPITATAATTVFGYIIGLSSLFHALTCIPMNTIPYGNRDLTVPLYFGATFINIINSSTLLIGNITSGSTDPRQILNTWAGVNIFILVRFQLALGRLRVQRPLLEPWYSYSLATAGLLVITLTQQNPYFLILFGLPGPSAYFLRKIRFKFLNVPKKYVDDEFENKEDIDIPETTTTTTTMSAVSKDPEATSSTSLDGHDGDETATIIEQRTTDQVWIRDSSNDGRHLHSESLI
ncbi:hypothetical protein HDV05_004700 [Chytridiales sp. JEL 0842]|nr:hypothetical protein HDV05_004700 [Chytridiales sp. JEL 0842]